MRSLLLIGSAAAFLKGISKPDKQGNTYGSKADACQACYATISQSCGSYLGYQCSAGNSADIGRGKLKNDGKTDYSKEKGSDYESAEDAKSSKFAGGNDSSIGQLGQTDWDDWYFSVNAEGAGSAFSPCCNAFTEDTTYMSSICTTYDPNGDATAVDADKPENENHHAWCTAKLAGYPTVSA